MITIKQIRGAKNYFNKYLSQNEYYSEGEKVLGYWRGKLAEMWGIEGKEVTGIDFEELGNNRHPITGDKLRPRSAKVQFHDVVISAPKSYSIAAIVGKDDRLIEGFRHVAEKAFRRLEKCAAVRDRAGDAYSTENYLTTGNGATAFFLHDDNRLLDPQLHMHLVFSNHSFSTEKGDYFALQPKIMMDEAKRWITNQFHRDLAKVARDAGYEVALPNNRLRLTGIGLRLEYKFSKRMQKRRKFEKRYRKMFGRKPDKKRIEHFIKEGKSAAQKRFTEEYQAYFGKHPTSKQIDEFVVDWRPGKKKGESNVDKSLYQRSQLTGHDAKRLYGAVDESREKERDRLENQALENQGEQQYREVGESSLANTKPKQERKQPSQRKQVIQNGVSRKKKIARSKAHKNAVGRIEAIRRMRRGMDVARALQGNPAMFLVRQITMQARRMNDYENNRESQKMF